MIERICDYCGASQAGTHLHSCPRVRRNMPTPNTAFNQDKIDSLTADRNRWMSAANDLRVKLAKSVEVQAACIGHTADIVVYRTTLKLALRALAHYRDDDDQVLVAIRNALARGVVR